MPVLLTVERVLPCPPEAAFALALDPQRFPQLFRGYGPIPALRSITLDAPLAVGSTRQVDSSDGSRLLERIVEFAPPHRHAYVLSGLRPPLGWLVREGRADWTFAPDGNGTCVTWQYSFELTSPLAWPLAAPLLRIFMRGAMQRCLDAMVTACQAVEASA